MKSALPKSNRVGRATRQFAVFVGFLALAAAAEADWVIVEGELSFNSMGIGKVAECEGGRIFTLGEMRRDPYLRLVDRYWRSSNQGKTPVMVKVSGGLSRAIPEGRELIIQSPNVVTMTSGRCGS
jgi:hypothetical protein